MTRWVQRRVLFAGLGTVAAVGVASLVAISCGTAPTPFLVSGPGQFGNVPPTLTFQEPTSNLVRGQGDPFLIRWEDTDPDDNALIDFWLVNTETNAALALVQGIEENDLSGPSSFLVNTDLVPTGTYNLLGTISDGINETVNVFAQVTGGPTAQRLLVTIVGEGEGPQTVPPVITVTEPSFNLSVAQEDTLTVTVQPTELAPAEGRPFDPDSDVTVFLVLDLDLDPNNDDPANPDPSQIIVLAQRMLAAGAFEQTEFDVTIDLAVVPPRPAGEPYFIRVTADDGTNPRVHSYATGSINVVQLAAGQVDLFDIGRTRAGARFYGFNPGANLGSSISSVDDFDDDGTADFVIVAQFGNPRNAGPVGEAYLVYGQANNRFGGAIAANSISETVSGVVFEAPPVRLNFGPDFSPGGITDVSWVRDLSGDGRPELLFGLPLVLGAMEEMDYDPADESIQDVDPVGCYPDLLVNNCTDNPPENLCPSVEAGEDDNLTAMGMATIIHSENRDNAGADINPVRLESTSVALEQVGQRAGEQVDVNGVSRLPGAEDPDEEDLRIAGARFAAGAYDFVRHLAVAFTPPRQGRYGETVASIRDLNQDGLDEILVSAPLNEVYLNDPFIPTTHFFSSGFIGSIIVLPGADYNDGFWRDFDGGSSVIPTLSHDFGGRCSDPEIRGFPTPSESFEIFAENATDRLGGARSARDFNQDGVDDILCGAPLNNRSGLTDSGAVYIVYGRALTGNIFLENAADPILRPPMLRIRGVTTGDQIGWRQSAALDVNGDRIDDVLFSSPRTDFGGVTRATCAADFNQDGSVDAIDLDFAAFLECQIEFADTEVFSDDACAAFDYDNDRDIDEDDRCVFCCLSGGCEVEETCVLGTNSAACCENLVDNGFVGVVFGGVFTDGDRDITQLASSDLAGTVFFGSATGHRAGVDVASAGDFNQDGFGDILIAVPGETRLDSAQRERLGVVYLVFGGTHLNNRTWNLSQVGSTELPGIVFLSPYVKGRPNEAPPTAVATLGDVNSDGFADIAVGNPLADFIDLSFPQGPEAPGSDAGVGRRRNAGDMYLIYGNNFGTNRIRP